MASRLRPATNCRRSVASAGIRAGFFRGSRDEAAGDGRHETFYQMLPTVRKYSYTTTYNLMNNTDRFVQVLFSPAAQLQVRVDFHILSLAESEDLWWQGAGATQSHGVIQGFSGRPSGGNRSLANSIEASASYQFSPMLGLHLFYGHMEGRKVIEQLFTNQDEFDLFFTEPNVRF